MESLSTKIRFSDEQAMLLETAVSFCREKSPIPAVRAQIDTPLGYDPALWSEIVKLGWTGIAVPERFGGSGLSLAEVATIAEPMGRHLFATPFTSTQLFTAGLLAGGSEAQQGALLPRISDGTVGTVALFERDGDWRLNEPETAVRIDGDRASLSGVKTLVGDAGVADLFLVSASVSGAGASAAGAAGASAAGPALAIVRAADLPAGAVRRETVIDETRRSYQIDLSGVVVPAASLITGPKARAALDAIRNAALLIASAEAAGGIAGALDVIVEYLNLRTTFGRKIGSYQSLKHTAADILVSLERSRSHVYHAATLLADGDDAELALRMAKVEACDGLAHAGDRAVQFHGGFGFTYECNAQLFLRRGLWLQYAFGDSAHHRRRLAERLLPV